jgi:hypothetical protein
MAVIHRWLPLSVVAMGVEPGKGRKMNFHIGDEVKVGTRVGTITDVGTVLIHVKTAEGGLRVVCPWELVKILG